MALGLAGRALGSRRVDAPGVDIAEVGDVVFENEGVLDATADGVFRLRDNARTSFGRLCWGPATASFPAWKYVAGPPIGFEARLGDDSAGCAVTAASWALPAAGTVTWAGQMQLDSPAVGQLRMLGLGGTNNESLIVDAETTADTVALSSGTGVTDMTWTGALQIGDMLRWGTTASEPALKPSTTPSTQLNVMLADGSTVTGLFARYLVVGPTDSFFWSGRSKMYSPADGQWQLDLSTPAAANSLLMDVATTADVLALTQSDGTDLSLKIGTGGTLLSNAVNNEFKIQGSGGTHNESLIIDTDYSANYINYKSDSGVLTHYFSGGVVADGLVQVGAVGTLAWGSRSRMTSPADGQWQLDRNTPAAANSLLMDVATTADVLALTQSDGTDIGLQIGGTLRWGATSSYPALQRNAAVLYAKLADDSAFTSIQALTLITTNTTSSFIAPAGGEYIYTGRTRVSAPADGRFLLTDQAGTAFDLLQLGGTTNGYPALKRNGASLMTVYADDSGYANHHVLNLYASASAQVATGGNVTWGVRSRIFSDADGNFRLTDTVGNDFGLLQFGGITSAYPALKRAGTVLEAKLADDSGYAAFRAGPVVSTTTIRAAAASDIYWDSRSKMTAPADGKWQLDRNTPAAANSVLMDVATTADVLALTQSDGTDIGLQIGSATEFAWANRARLYSPADGAIELAASGGTGTACYQVLNEFASGSDPAAAAANTVRLYVRDNGAGKGELCARFPTGAVQVVASEP